MDRLYGNRGKAVFQNGSRWLRADFRLHTRADKEFVYTGGPGDFVKDYVNKLVERDIRVGVITNHNKFDSDEYKAIAEKAINENIFILPGVELSAGDGANGVHTLIAFDPREWLTDGDDYISQFITTNLAGKYNPEDKNDRSNYSLKETLEQLTGFGKKYFEMTAHVERNSGLLLEGGDPKSIEDMGRGEAYYIKIGDYNFEAVRFSLIDFKNRFSITGIPKIQNSYIKSISFQGGLLNETTISFSPELNNLIGIRGSGKSSVLEILRYALNIPFGAQAVDREYKDGLVKHVLKSGGKVVVEIVNRHGKTYRVERIYGQEEDIYEDSVLRRGISPDSILRQPVYFGQKDLSNKNADFENDLINKLAGGKLNDLRIKIDNQKQEILRIVNELKSLSDLSRLKKETETAKANAEHKLKTFRDKGIAEKLQRQTSFESDARWMRGRKSNIAGYIDELRSIVQNYENSLTMPARSNVNGEFFNGVNDLIGKLGAGLEQVKVILADSKKIDADFQILLDKLLAKEEELKEEFAKIKREIDTPELNPDDFIAINRELETSKLKLIEIEKSEERRVEFGKQLDESLARLNNLWRERFALLNGEIGKINENGGKLSIEIVYKGRKDKFRDKLQDVFKELGIRTGVYNEISGLYADFIDMYKDEFRKLSEVLTESQLVGFKDRYHSALCDLLTYMVENQITIYFDGKPLREHSLGQRASALILFLLSQKENDILIIDQPEDDLDNQTIYEDVIRAIKSLKGRMQFIFATHNANIPVLGDSEMAICCGYVPDSEMTVETGSVDRRIIQEKIIKIMEGGKEAFDMRKNIYKIWSDGKP